MEQAELYKMVSDYMESGYLENIIDMFRHDLLLYEALPLLITDDRSRVRLGTVALLETLRTEPDHAAAMKKQIRPLAAQLVHPNPTIRGDLVYLLGTIGSDDVMTPLRARLDMEDHPGVRELIKETLKELET